MAAAVVDTSAWISLARAGLLPLLSRLPLQPILTDVVRREAVEEGLAGGNGDARAIREAATGPVMPTAHEAETVDEAVLLAAAVVGTLVANDLALGRRARTMGMRWLRSADLIVLAVRSGTLSTIEGRRAVQALLAAGRITAELADAYLAELA